MIEPWITLWTLENTDRRHEQCQTELQRLGDIWELDWDCNWMGTRWYQWKLQTMSDSTVVRLGNICEIKWNCY